MRRDVFKGYRKVELLNFEDPVPKHGEVVIEMKASGMCGSDLHFYRNKPSEVIKSLGFRISRHAASIRTRRSLAAMSPAG